MLPQLLTPGIVRRACSPNLPDRGFKLAPEWRMLKSMTSDNAGTVSVVDFRRQGMVLQWHVSGGTWSAYEMPPSLVHGVALIRAAQPNICVYAPRRPVAPADRSGSVHPVGELTAHQVHPRLARHSDCAGASPSNRAPAACCSAMPYWTPSGARISSTGSRPRRKIRIGARRPGGNGRRASRRPGCARAERAAPVSAGSRAGRLPHRSGSATRPAPSRPDRCCMMRTRCRRCTR